MERCERSAPRRGVSALPEAGEGYEGGGGDLGQSVSLQVETLQPTHVMEHPGEERWYYTSRW